MNRTEFSLGSLFSNVINAGSTEGLPKQLAKRVQPTNIVALVLFLMVGLPFTAITHIYFPSLVWYPLGGGLLCASTIVLNYLGAIKYSRLIISLIPITLGAIYNAYLSGPEDGPLPSLYLLELSFSLIPLVVYDPKEKKAIFLTLCCCILIITTFPITKQWFNSTYDSTILRSGWLNSATIVLALFTQISCVLGLLSISNKAEKESDDLRKIAEDEKRRLESEQEESIKKAEELRIKQIEEKKLQWTNEGITSISKIIRDHEDQDKLYDRVLAAIVKYVNANQGNLFIVEGEKNNAEILLKACYAYGRKKYTEQIILPGQGLVGQTFLERQYTYLTQVPQNYINITSGLGEATPETLLILPLIANDTVQGLLELASFKKLAPHEIHFLEKLGEILAGQINSQKIVVQTQHLLQQAQEQSEELRAQEEEMRQNMEELAATQEHSQRQADENKKLYEQLYVREHVFGLTTILSEADLYGTITFANDKLCEVSKYSRVELIGQGHNIFRHSEMPKGLFKLFWQTIKGGKVFRGIIKNRAKDGTHYWVDATIVPIKNEKGEIYKYIGARYHITDDLMAEHLYAKQQKALGIEEGSKI
ncbi:PAS domain-containing protein [Catalinimonas sp. 4WD22]|uniref:PAS domain-containing protein n=1 Tax=Catalinimonas locisalis TaxID=3133978 RepID=UPI0031010FAA